MKRDRPSGPAPALVAILAFLVALSATSGPAYAKKKDRKQDGKKAIAGGAEAKQEEKKDEDSPFKEWDKVLKDAETKAGLFTVHRKHDNIWLEVKADQLGKQMLMASSVSRGLARGRLLGGMPLDTDIWVFQRAGNKLQILVANTRFAADKDTPMARAVELSYGDSVLASPKIVSIHKETGNLLIDLNEVLITDLPGLALALKASLGGPAAFDKDRTVVGGIKVFPKNLEIEVSAVYTSGDPKPIDSVADPRYLTVGVHYSLSQLPENDYRPRLADDRVGYFLTAVKNFSRDSADSFFVRYINRWRLEKQDPAAFLSPPKEPIVFYLDTTIPEEYRQYVREGILMWNKAFEKAGFKDAMVVKDPPDDPDFDPEDVRYNTIRWITSTEPSFGAIGPSRVDPRNGHILDADILVEAAMVQNARRGYRTYQGTLARGAAGAALSPYALGANAPATAAEWLSLLGHSPDHVCDFAEGAELGAAVDAAFLQVTGEVAPGGLVPEEYVREFLHWVISHEVGHTLGLRHNFRASAATPFARLNDTAWTRENGLYNSVMEYPVANVSLDRAKQGDYYTRTVGTYDRWAIQYGYAPVDASSPEAELPALRAIAEKAGAPGLEYGTDEDAFAGPVPLGVDPDVNQFDLGSDPVAWGRARLALIRSVRDKIGATLTAPGEGYDRLRNTMNSLVTAQGQALQIVSKQVGGLSTSRSHKGDPNEKPAFTRVSPERQREAMAVVIESGLSRDAWTVDPALLDKLQPPRFWHWGTDMTQALPFDYPFTDRVLGVQTELLDRLMHPLLMSRMLETEARSPKGSAYTLAEHMRTLTDASFVQLAAKGASGPLVLDPIERNLGRAMLDRMIALANTPPAGTPDDARSFARAGLVGLERRIGSALGTRAAGMDEATKVYLEEARARIRRALEAQTIVAG